MSTVVGPFTVEDAELLPMAQAVAAAIPADIAAADPPGVFHIWSSRRFGAPSWSYGYTPSRSKAYINPRRHALAHEYAHGWWARHGRRVGGNAALRALVDNPAAIGRTQTRHFSDRLSEAFAHAFAAAIGQPDGVRATYFRVKIPPANYGALLELMGKALAELTRPTHTYRRSRRVALRAEARHDSPALLWAESGDEIRAEAGLSGGRYAIRLPGSGDGSRSRLWLVVSAHNGRRLDTPAYTAELAWLPLAAIPAELP